MIRDFCTSFYEKNNLKGGMAMKRVMRHFARKLNGNLCHPILALALLACGILSIWATGGDGTVFFGVVILLIAALFV